MPEVTYTGHMSVTYMDYMDTDTGHVLQVIPGGTYNIQATGFNAPDVPPNDFVLAEDDENEDEETENEELTPTPEPVEE